MSPGERELLEAVARNAGLSAPEVGQFLSEVERRLEMGATEYGEYGYLRRSFSELVGGEAREEQHDAGGWSSLGLRLLEGDVANGFPSDQAEIVRLHVIHGVALALQSAREFAQAVRHYDEYADQIQPPPERPISCHDERLLP